ncbi:MAG TPA: hypothetical protein VFZ17_12325 [Acidimicrobiia bacterium]|nr:hypothetical protein [Acidimicrobiia bacterium]
MARTATAVWRITPEVVRALDEHLGLPVDSYVNGTQTWLVERDEPEVTLEWRLHPVAGYRPPAGLSHYDLWEQVVMQVATGGAPDSLVLGGEPRTLLSIWDGLECFVPFDDDLEPARLAQAVTDVLHLVPDAVGLVDHGRIGAAWEQANGTVSIVEMLLAELHT